VPFVSRACAAAGAAGAASTTVGAVALLHARLTDPKLVSYSAPADYFNLALFASMAPTLALGVWLDGSPLPVLGRRLLTFDTHGGVHPVLACGMVFASLVLAYIPFTHMWHFAAKWFTYHHVRWDDAVAGERARAKVAEYLTYRPTWAAGHVGCDGTKTWSDVATGPPPARERT
jgi:nitrate reductase gamma subunit